MYIPELIIPGTWLDLLDRDLAWTAQSLLYPLENGLDEAAVALDLFEKAQATRHTRITGEAWRREMNRQGTLRAKYDSDSGTAAANLPSYEMRFQAEAEARFRAEVAAKREDWNAGNLPKEYPRLLPFLYAKAFLYALDGILKVLRELEHLDVPSTVKTQANAFRAAFPTLPHVRNSTAHAEQRLLGRDRDRKPLKLKEPVIVIDSLAGTRFGGTMEDGAYGDVDVSAVTLEQARAIVQAILDAFPWKGAPRHHPSWTGP